MFQRLAKVNQAMGVVTQRSSAVPLSVIGPDVRIVGDIITQGEMQIDGQVEGDITCHKLVVGEGAVISGAVTAETVKVHGTLSGRVNAGTIVIARSAKVVGDINHDSLEIEAGAEIEGHIVRKAPSAHDGKKAAAPHAKKGNGAAQPQPQPQPEPAPAPAEPPVEIQTVN
ncbi:polymer-forming cytoskeletal protein [Magnetospirillum sp. UT-4]|uniref:bactofilin family protein n=1 Tax=Magnetospirillum sp. UT-4 TaxID=2681467 RepID=UPI001385E8DD|nr:polymer-forming cytoskeletal protein [Magnetospirillum sp. UT-4]CAA7617702.1 Integral membrane protein CcmA involved in cell shape determination (modular protein) [Magnetospirillum sp. UT-4]